MQSLTLVHPQSDAQLEKAVLNCVFLIEAFSHAKSVHNHSSSRCGVVYELEYNGNEGTADWLQTNGLNSRVSSYWRICVYASAGGASGHSAEEARDKFSYFLSGISAVLVFCALTSTDGRSCTDAPDHSDKRFCCCVRTNISIYYKLTAKGWVFICSEPLTTHSR